VGDNAGFVLDDPTDGLDGLVFLELQRRDIPTLPASKNNKNKCLPLATHTAIFLMFT